MRFRSGLSASHFIISVLFWGKAIFLSSRMYDYILDAQSRTSPENDSNSGVK